MFGKRLGSIASISLFMVGCQSPSPEIRALNRPIINGSNDTIATHDAVVALTDNTGFSFCTGTFVGARTIVSAGHCLEFGGPDLVYFGSNSDDDAANCPGALGPECGFFQIVETADPGFNGAALENDLSVVRIDQDPVLNGVPVAPIPFTRFSDGTNLSVADEGQLVSFSGYGVINGTTQAGDGTKLVVDGITLEAVGPANVGGTAGTIISSQVYYLQPKNIGGPCSGDSGGPMFVTRNGVEFLAGVTSFGDFNCELDGISTRVDSFDAFIEGFCGSPNCGQGAPACNNSGSIDPGEACDGADLGGQSCLSIGFDEGTLSCNASCGFDKSGCQKTDVLPEACNNNVDDDQDGAVDCADSDCANANNCRPPDEVCADGLDNDEDGDTDCDDADCNIDPACQSGRRCSVEPATTSSHHESAVALLFALFGLSLVFSRKRN